MLEFKLTILDHESPPLTKIPGMKLFSRRRWTTGLLAQESNNYGYYAMHALHNFLGFNINKTALCLGRSNLHLLLLKSSMDQGFRNLMHSKSVLQLWSHRLFTEADVDGDVGVVRRRVRAKEPLLLPPNSKVHREADGEFDVVNFKNL